MTLQNVLLIYLINNCKIREELILREYHSAYCIESPCLSAYVHQVILSNFIAFLECFILFVDLTISS